MLHKLKRIIYLFIFIAEVIDGCYPKNLTIDTSDEFGWVIMIRNNTNCSFSNVTERLDTNVRELIKHQYIVSGWLSLIAAIIGIIGNILTIKILLKSSMRSPINTFITGLALTDLISLHLIIFLVPLRYIFVSHNVLFFYELHTRSYPYIYPLAATFQFSSIYLIVVTSTSRVVTLYFPVKFRLNSIKNCFKIICLIYLFSILSCLPFWFYYRTEYIKTIFSNVTKIYLNYSTLAYNLTYRFYFHIYIMVLTYVIPLIVLLIMNYSLVAFLIQTRQRKNRLGLRERNELMITVILIMYVFLFFLCQMPNFFLHVLQAVNMKLGNKVTHTYFHQWANFLIILNSSYSFMIYCALSEEFREEAKKIFTCYRFYSYIDAYKTFRSNSRRRTGLPLTQIEIKYNHKNGNEIIEIIKCEQSNSLWP